MVSSRNQNSEYAQSIARFAREQLLPHVAIADESNGEHEVIRTLFEQAWNLQIPFARVPSEYDGPGLLHVDYCIVVEQLSWACTGLQVLCCGNSLATTALVIAGDDAQKRHYFGRLLRSPTWASLAASESNAGSDLAAIQCKARRVGHEWALTGDKAWVSNGPLADWFVVFATTDLAAQKAGISAFLVDRKTAGVSVGRHEKKLGQRASPTASLILQDARAELLAEKGYKLALATFGQTRPEIAAAATGLQRRALDESLEYAKQRVTFGVPLIEHQLVAGMLADMHTRWQASCLLTQNAAAALDQGDANPLASSTAKLFAADAAVATASDAIQIFGGNGYVRDYPVEKLFRDAKVLQIYEGTSQIQKLVIAKSLGR